MYIYFFLYFLPPSFPSLSLPPSTAQEPSFSSSMACLFGEEAPLSLSPHANWDRSSTQYYNVQYTEGVACGYHKVEHLRLRIYSLHSTVL